MRLLIMICVIGLAGLAILLQESEVAGVGADIKINGVSLVNPPFRIDSADMSSLKRINGGWVAVIPIAFSRDNEPEVYFNHPRQWWGERLDGTAELISLAHSNRLNVMLKPHVWMREKWIGEFDLDSEEKWVRWEQAYRDYILSCARVADSMNVALFCIGTEYKVAVVERPAYWKDLIVEIRRVYGGPLTYAANWDNYQDVSLWQDLDLIGINGYFPLSSESHPDQAALEMAWQPIREEMRRFGQEAGRPVLFTEYGYQSVDGAAGNHWEVIRSPENLNLEIQATAYECLFKCLWREKWFAGGFLWKWHFREGVGGPENLDFTPQGKPVEEVIARWYGTGLSGVD